MRLTVFFFFVFACALANAQSLWKSSVYKMTPHQVQELFPSAIRPAEPDSLNSGATELLRISEIELEGYAFAASFFFKEDGLEQVMLIATGIENGLDGRRAYAALAKALTAKYGDQLPAIEPPKNETNQSLSWVEGKTNITLLYREYSYSAPILNVIYRVRPST